MVKQHFQAGIAVCAGFLSIAVVWYISLIKLLIFECILKCFHGCRCEVTFFNKSPVLSIFARIVNVAKDKYDYFTIEVSLLELSSF